MWFRRKHGENWESWNIQVCPPGVDTCHPTILNKIVQYQVKTGCCKNCGRGGVVGPSQPHHMSTMRTDCDGIEGVCWFRCCEFISWSYWNCFVEGDCAVGLLGRWTLKSVVFLFGVFFRGMFCRGERWGGKMRRSMKMVTCGSYGFWWTLLLKRDWLGTWLPWCTSNFGCE